MKNLHNIRPLTCVSAVVLLIAATNVWAVTAREYPLENGGALAPHLAIDIANDDNPLRSEAGSIASTFLRVQPTLDFIARRRNNRLSIGYSGNYVQYFEQFCRSEDGSCSPGESSIDRASYQDHNVNAEGFAEVNRRTRLTGRLSLGRLSYPIGSRSRTGATDEASSFKLQPDSLRSSEVFLGLSYGALRARGEIRASLNYLDGDFSTETGNSQNDADVEQSRSENTVTPAAALYYRLGARVKAFGGVSLSQTRGGSAERDSNSVFAGLEFSATGITSGSITVGNFTQDFLDNRRNDSFFRWDVDLTWRPRTYSTITVSGGRRPVRGLFEDSVLGVGIEGALGVEWKHYWSELMSTNLEVGVLDHSQDDVAGNLNSTTRAVRFTGTYNIRRWLDIGAFVEADRRSGDNGDYDRTVIGITANGTI